MANILLLVICPGLFCPSQQPVNVRVSVDLARVVSTIDEAFYGVALDASLFTSTGLRKDIDLKSKKLAALLKGISPGYFRVGGTSANWLFYGIPGKQLDSLGFPRANIMTNENLDDLVSLTRNANMRLLFDLNANLRFGHVWNPSDAIRLFEYCKIKNYGENIDWELGNEPNHGSIAQLELFTPDQVAEDFIKLSALLKTYGIFNDSWLVGCDVGGAGLSYFKSVDRIAGDHLQAYTFHHYYFDGSIATTENYTDPKIFGRLEHFFSRIESVLKHSVHKGKPIWLGETSIGYRSGTRGISDRYVSGFLSLDKFGLSAASNISVVIRQTIFNGHYGLLNHRTLEPNPDYWQTWLHHKLVGRKVFRVVVHKSHQLVQNTVRAYAHCAKETFYRSGALVVFAVNVHPNSSVKLQFDDDKYHNFNGIIEAYILKPTNRNLLSRDVLLNGKPLQMEDGDKMPKLPPPVVVKNAILESLTFGFFVFPNARVEPCMTTRN